MYFITYKYSYGAKFQSYRPLFRISVDGLCASGELIIEEIAAGQHSRASWRCIRRVLASGCNAVSSRRCVQNVGKFVPDYMVSHAENNTSPYACLAL
jgi:hypothetical protein